jgi:hypothetical protein
MGKFDNLNDSQIPEILRRLERLERATPMNNAAIGRGGFEVYDGGVINVSNGGLNVTGTATITGTLQADGTITFTGTLTQSGPSTFTGDTKLNGPTHINGATDITGTFSVEGATTLKGDMTLTTGKIKAGAITIDPSANSGSVLFSTGAKLANYGAGLAMQLGSSVAGVTSNGVSLGTPSANIITSESDGMTGITGKLQVGNLPNSAIKANVYVDANGNFFRSTAP